MQLKYDIAEGIDIPIREPTNEFENVPQNELKMYQQL